MDASPALHPTDQTLSSFGLGKLDDRSAEAVNEHLMQCSDCRQRVAEISSDSFLQRFRAAQPAGKSPSGPSQTGGIASGKVQRAPAPPPASTVPPELVNHPDYEIKRELGRGGMGVVYLAHNTLMGRDEVLKVMGRDIMERRGVLDRFLREIRAVARLRHPNIVTAYHATRLGESIVFAMEYVEGLDLSKLVKAKGPLPVGHACNFIHQAALGLQHAHEEGLVHRDIKPHNLMLSRKGDKATVKILDFGLAKAAREEKVDGGLTTEGQALGTPDYVAPEQILDAPSADIRADIYSLGGTLYYLLTGHPPFQAKSLYDLYQAHISRDADPLNLVRPEVPVELAALVSRMMAKEPSRRFQTPGEVAQALAPFFKKGNVALKSPGADISQAGWTNTAGNAPGTVPAATPPETDADRLVVSARQAAGPAAAEPRSESMIEFREPESSPEVAKDVAPRRRTRWPLIAAAGVFGLFLLGVIIYVATDKGRIKMVVNDPKAVVKIDGEEVHIEALGAPITLRAGAHALEVKWGDGEFQTRRFVVRRGENEDLRVEYEPTRSRATASREKPPEAAPKPGTGADSSVPLKQITNSVGMKLVLIPAGEFLMGSPGSDPDASDVEKPQHRVRITRPFYVGVHEVTQGQYRAVTGTNPSHFKGSDDLPVEQVSWNDAIAFCDKLSVRDGLKPFDHLNARGPWDGEGYRLPTEAEWEYACRAGSATRYSFGDNASKLGEFAWYDVNSGGKTHPVGEKRPNAWGLYDMQGNVHELCWDGYKSDYYKQTPADDPSGPSGASRRVSRGGSWGLNLQDARSTQRRSDSPRGRYFDLGFRVARAPSVQPVHVAEPAPAPPARAQAPKELTNTIGMKLVPIPAGEFLMGSPGSGTDASNAEEPEHRVRITRPFYLGATEVTQGQYRAVTGQSPSKFKGSDDLPVEMVSWLDAVNFCNALSRAEGLSSFYRVDGPNVSVPDRKGSGYRLPTEAEWEYACRAKNPAQYSFGDDPAGLGEYAWLSGNSGNQTHPVGQKRPNAFGLFDMHGNVWEWCWDWLDTKYYDKSPVDDPRGPAGRGERVFRGGSWQSPPQWARSANRGWHTPVYRNYGVGFRLAQVRSD